MGLCRCFPTATFNVVVPSFWLALLRDKAMYGYEIVRELRERSEGYFAMEEGLLYPTLHKLERGRGWSGPSGGSLVVGAAGTMP